MMISSAVAHAAALFKNHLPDLNMELLCQDFTVDDAERETLVSSTFDAAQDFVSSYDFASLAESDDNDGFVIFFFCILDELDEDRYIDAPCFLYIDNNCIREVY
jgi:hypothetical protein